MRFFEGLCAVVANRNRDIPFLLLGDCNQFIPRKWGSKNAAVALRDALGELIVVTEGPIPGVDRPAIDHIAHCAKMRASQVWGLSDRGDQGVRLSDHFGIAASLTSR